VRDGYGDASVIYGGHGPRFTTRARRSMSTSRIGKTRSGDRRRARARTGDDPAMVETIYRDIDRRYGPLRRQILAYLIALEREGRVTATPRNDALTPEERALLDPD